MSLFSRILPTRTQIAPQIDSRKQARVPKGKRATVRLVTLGLIAGLLSACAASPEQTTHYYLLNSDSDVIHKQHTQHVIGIAPIAVADYINNSGIAVLTRQNRIQLANFHLWAEQPDRAITRVLYDELNRLLSDSQVDNGMLGRGNDWHYTLTTQVDQFHGTEQGSATFSGYWQLRSEGKVLLNHRFNLQATIDNSSYEALVDTLRHLISQLADDQAKQIQQVIQSKST